MLSTIVKLFSYDLQQYPLQLRANQTYLLPEAQNAYLSILNSMAHLGEYTTKDTVVSVVYPKGAPSLYDQGVASGRYYWAFDLPIEIQFSGSILIPTQSLTLRIIIVRTSMDNDVYGIKIASITASGIRRN